MALANYVDLQASIASWSHRTDLTTLLPDIVTLAEARISRDIRLRKQITTTTLTCVSGTQSVSLPTDWLEFENISVSTSPSRQLVYVTVEQLDATYSSSVTGTPSFYTIEGDTVLFGPIPDAAYSIAAVYYARFASLITSSTNWLMTTHPNIYLHACLVEVFSYLRDKDQIAFWLSQYLAGVKALQDQDDEAMHSGSALRVKAI